MTVILWTLYSSLLIRFKKGSFGLSGCSCVIENREAFFCSFQVLGSIYTLPLGWCLPHTVKRRERLPCLSLILNFSRKQSFRSPTTLNDVSFWCWRPNLVLHECWAWVFPPQCLNGFVSLVMEAFCFATALSVFLSIFQGFSLTCYLIRVFEPALSNQFCKFL